MVVTMKQYDLVAENPESIVVAEYQAEYERAKNYQSEAELEKELIRTLQSQSYEYLPIKSENDLVQNLRMQLEKLNNYTFSNKEWKNFFTTKIANQNSGIEEKTTIIQEDFIQLLDNGETKNIYLIDKQNIHNNSLQVVNQYETETGSKTNRYDVTVLVNGLPLVHIELKRRGVILKRRLIKSTATNARVFGQVADCTNTYNYS